MSAFCTTRSGYFVLATMAVAWLATARAVRAAEGTSAASLPLKEVVLFTSGVGFFEHAGKVGGNAQVEMKFNVDDVNDLLKSMVVLDLDGGRISAVSYGSKDPITKTLKTFAVDLTTSPTVAQLLGQIRGERVELEAADKITGVILGVERQKRKVGDDEVIEVDVLNLLTDEGLRSVSLETVGRIRLVNEKLDAELRQALALLASGHATDKKTVTLNLLGEGERRVEVGYIQETPIWKTTYRLVLADEKAPLLQGWAIVENTTEEDWSDVRLTLVSGRPISFVMNLYQPLYVPRPEERLPLYASLRPQTYGQDMADKEVAFRRLALAETAPAEDAAKAPARPGQSLARAAGKSERELRDQDGAALHYWAAGAMGEQLRQTIQSVAEAGEVGELFQYVVDTPVSLARQQSAMLPIVNADVKGEKVSIYNPQVHAKHPLAGLKLTNATELHLMQGPITVFDGGVYAGDAQIADLPPGQTRLISYALDLDTEVVAKPVGRPGELVSVRLVKGTMIVTRKFAKTVEYTIKNSGGKEKTVLVEQPIEGDWKLVAPKEPAEKTRDRYRFAVKAAPGKPAALRVDEERTASEHVALSNVNDDTVRVFVSAKAVDQKVKDALTKIVEQKLALEKLIAERKQYEAQIEVIGREQERIRANMARLDRAGDLYKRYVKKFTEQEDTIEQLRGKIETLVEKETAARRALDEYMAGLDL
ncbi:MAG: hypothetical protein JW809_17970 [Pirellulales bacterium]|nr:hypothetical protein [Pirellulales bacterium]